MRRWRPYGSLGGGAGEATGGEAPAKSGQLVEHFGAIVGKQLVSGGQNVEHELISRVRGRLLTAFDGQLGKLEGLS